MTDEEHCFGIFDRLEFKWRKKAIGSKKRERGGSARSRLIRDLLYDSGRSGQGYMSRTDMVYWFLSTTEMLYNTSLGACQVLHLVTSEVR